MSARWSLCALAVAAVACSDPPRPECETSDDCHAGLRCQTRRCVSPVFCARDGDCEVEQICIGDVCDVRQCVTDARCGADRVCVDGWCRARPPGYCTTDAECAPGTCDIPMRRCLVAIAACPDAGCLDGGGPEICVADDGCTLDQYCADGQCLTGCRLASGACGDGRACDPATRRCTRLPCAADADCPAARFCAGGAVCRIGCRLEEDACGGGACDPARRRCVGERCQRLADCPPDQVCALDPDSGPLRCRFADAGAPSGAPCQTPEECAPRWCVDGRCLTACAADEDCAEGVCRPVHIELSDEAGLTVLGCRARPEACAADAECPDDARCVPGPESQALTLVLVCVPPQGRGAHEPTNAVDECDSGLVVEGRCWGPCRLGATDCPAGARCYASGLYLVDARGTPTPSDDVFAGVPACAPDQGSGSPCGDAPCTGGEVCVPRPDATRTEFVAVCLRPFGPRAGGAPCDAHDQCRSRWCAEHCVEHCARDRADASCVLGARCEAVSLAVWDRGTPDLQDDPSAEVSICVLR